MKYKTTEKLKENRKIYNIQTQYKISIVSLYTNNNDIENEILKMISPIKNKVYQALGRKSNKIYLKVLHWILQTLFYYF